MTVRTVNRRKAGNVDVVVVGAGHSGLAMSRELALRSIEHVVLERGEVALVIDDDRHVVAILTKLDLIEMLASRGPQHQEPGQPSA